MGGMSSAAARVFRPALALALIVVAAFAARMMGLAAVPPRWDEGWSIAHASLPIGELLRITAADVHPPLYYLALGVWQAVVGQNLFAVRFLGVLVSLLCVPLAYVVAFAWTGRRGGLPLLAAGAMAWLPLAVYYSAVARMYAFAPAFLLLAAWGALQPNRRRAGVAFVLGAVGAMLTLYHAVWPLAALSAYALIRATGPQRRRLLGWTAIAAGLYVPWATYAVPQLLGRAAAEGATNIGQQFSVGYFVENGLIGLTMSQWAGWLGVAAHGLLLGLGALIAQRRRAVWLPVLAIVATLFGVAAAARNWAFNARMLIGAAPFLALGLAWAVDALARRARGTAALAVLGLLAVYAPTSALLVPAKTLEVFDPYNPRTYAEHLAPQGRATDLAVFNVLSPAGFYSLDRTPSMPAWSYALTWDPVIEPRALWEARITGAAQTRDRLWLVLYRGLAGKNGDLRGWMDSTFYPAGSEWGEEEVFYGLYGFARRPLVEAGGAGARWGDFELRQARTADSVSPGSVIPVALTWRANTPIKTNAKIFVHALAADGRLIAQHDAMPLNDLRPMVSLPPGEDVLDHHGLALPAEYTGTVRIVLGLYDPATGQRLKTSDGREIIELRTGLVVDRSP